jgi:hypothetical protein
LLKENFPRSTLDVKIACKKSNANFEKMVYAYTETSIGMFEAFISCWDENTEVTFALKL